MNRLIIALCLTSICLLFGCQSAVTKRECTAEPNAVVELKVVIKPEGVEEKPAETISEGLGPYKLGSDEMDNQGFVMNWLIVGPFPNPGERPDNKGYDIDYLKDYGTESGHIPAAGMEIKRPDGTVVKWQPYKSENATIGFFLVDHLALEYEQEDILTYSACWLECDKDVDVQIRVGTDDGYKLWLDNKLLAAEHVYRACELDQESYPVTLTKGRHLILIKVDQDYGEFQFMLRIVTPDGKAPQGVKVLN
jgi:hypothetical protein